MDFDFSDRPLEPEEIMANAEAEEAEEADLYVDEKEATPEPEKPVETFEHIQEEYEAIESLVSMGYTVDEQGKSLVDEEEELKQKAIILGYDEKEL